jgi:5-formyltetrahydrofolate cyclo-ligase
MIENARELKKRKLGLRNALSTELQKQYSSRITKQLLQMDCFKQAEIVFVYVDFRSEVKTHDLIRTMFKQGKKVVVPVTLLQEKDLLPVQITNMERDLTPGYASILEPVESIRTLNYVLPENIDIIFLPGSVFDETGGRMGYGGGFYDRFVSQKAPQAHRVGLCYELQMVQKAPLQDHDESMDTIVTEQRILHYLRDS